MERLTTKNGGGHYLDLSDNPFSYDSIVCKLGAFEDFIEEQGFEDLEELKRYIEQSFKASELILKKKQENQALKDRWEKLKKWVDESGCFLDDGSFSGDVVISIYAILDKIQELEQGE